MRFLTSIYQLRWNFLVFLIFISIIFNSVEEISGKLHIGSDWNLVDEPVQLVRPDPQHKKLVIIEENVKLLHKIVSAVATVAVVGKFHSGKSFLMNQLMGKAGGFGIGPSVKPQTMGIWMWGKPMTLSQPNGEALSVVFLDTEGFAANNISETYDAKIFAVATLLSSYLIYNSVKIIDQSDIDYLEVLSRRTQLFALRSQLSKSKWTEAFNHDLLTFPPLMWVVQDFVQTTDDLTSTEWLHRLMSTHSRENEEYEISLMGIFNDIDCHTLFLPATQKKLLVNLSLATENDLTAEYRQERDALMTKLFSNLKPKEKNGKPISGSELATLLKILVTAANEGSLSSVPSRWNTFIQHLQVTATEDCLQLYESELQSLQEKYGNEPLIPKELQKWQDSTIKKLLSLLEQLLYGLQDAFEKARNELKLMIANKFEKLIDINDKKIKLKCSDVQGRILLRVDQKFGEVPLPVKTVELQRLIALNSNEAIKAFDSEVAPLISEETLDNYVSILKGSLKNLGDSLILRNTEAIESYFADRLKLATGRFIELSKNTDANPRIPKHLDISIKGAMEQSLKLYEENSFEFKSESMHKLYYALLKEQNEQYSLKLHQENEILVKNSALKLVAELITALEEETSLKYISLPVSSHELEAKLKNAQQILESKYESNMDDFQQYPTYVEQKKLLLSKANHVAQRRRKENVDAFTKEVSGPLNTCKKVVLLTADKYSTKFSLMQYIRKVCLLNLDEGRAKAWPAELKLQIVDNFINSDEELKRIINSREGWWSSVLGFFQWISWVLFGR